MSKRLQVIVPEADYRQIQHCAQAAQLTVAEWVRRALVAAQRGEPAGEAGRKLDGKLGAVRDATLEAAREAARDGAPLALPTGDISRMLADIELGYRGTGEWPSAWPFA